MTARKSAQEKGWATRRANALKKAAEEAAAEEAAKLKRQEASQKGWATRKANAVKKAAEEAAAKKAAAPRTRVPVIPVRYEAPMKQNPDGSWDVDYDKMEKEAPPAARERGGYLPGTAGGSVRDVIWKAGMSAKETILKRITDDDNKVIVRDIISDKAYLPGKKARIIWYFLPCPDVCKNSIDDLEGHLIPIVKKANPQAYNTAKASENYKANLDPEVGIAGFTDRYIGYGRGAVKGFNDEARRVAARLAASLGVE